LALLFSGLALLAGLGALVLTFSFFSFILVFMWPNLLGTKPLSLGWPLAFTLALTAGLFLDSLHSRRDDLSNVALWLMRESVGLGPRLLLESCRRARRAAQLVALDLDRCAEVLAWLAAKRKATPREELLRAFPGLVWRELRAELQLIEGVLFLGAEGGRVTLTPPLRLRLRQLVGPEARHETAEPKVDAAPVTEPEKLSSYEILGISASATRAEIKAAYRARIKECHPDRFVGLDAASLRSAEEWTKALNAAYAALVAESRR
jgi:hypothetical protein